MNRNTWIIIIVAVVVIIGLIWIFNRGAAEIDRTRPTVICLSSVERDHQTYCTSTIYGYPMTSSSSATEPQ